MSLDGVIKTEYSYAAAPGQGVQAAKTSYTNSVMTEAAKNAGNTSVEEKQNTSKLDELLEKLCAELSKYGLNPDELKKSGILFRITGMKEQQLNSVSEQELKQILECLKTAIIDTAVEGKVDLEKVGTAANKYYIALKTGWNSIEQYKKNQTGESLSARMERFFGLKEGEFAKLPQAKIKEYLERYFNQFFVDKLKNAKTPQEKNKIYKQQLQDFGKLLNNTPDSEKGVFKQAITSLLASNRIKGLDATLASFDTPAARTSWADSWTDQELEEFAIGVDIEGNVPSKADVTSAAAKITAQSSEEGIKTRHETFNNNAKTFFEENKDALAKIAEKEAKGIELTDEEKQLKLKRDNFFTAVSAGEISGTAINEIIGTTAQKELLAVMNKDAYELPNYKEVLEQVSEFIENNPEALTLPKEEITKLLDKATNGNYSTVAAGSETTMNPPVETKEEKEEVKTPDLGFSVSTTNVDTSKYNKLMEQIKPQENQTFTVENNDKLEPATNDISNKKLTSSELYTLKNEAFRSATNITNYLKETGETKFGFATEVFKKFSDMGSTTQDWAMNYFSNASSTVQNLFLNKITGSISGMVAAAKEVDLTKFNLIGVSITTQNQIDKIQQEKA